jgi:uncharacterized repeat protein (TIGR01451 family)
MGEGLNLFLPALLFVLASLPASAQFIVSGRITNPLGTPMTGVVVNITGSGNSFAITDTLGNYTATLPEGGAYTIAPYCNVNHLNGVSTLDLVLISKHWSNETPLTSPFQLIAADVDNNGLTDLTDSLEARKMILGIDPQFLYNTSWRFVRAGYVFPDSLNPFQPPYPESFSIPNLTANVSNVDFIGVKIGDINYTAIPANLTDSTHVSWIDGTVRIDENTDCVADAGEPALQNWVVRAQSPFGTFYGKSNAGGQFSIGVPPGTHTVTLLSPNNLWDICTNPLTNVTTTELNHTAVSFPVQIETECPYMEVDLATPFLRRCFNNVYTVQYCNKGTIAAENATVEVMFDPYLDVVGSSIPWSSVNGNNYTFALGDMQPGQCSSFYVIVYVDCAAEPGQTHCSSAHILPDTLCTPPNPLWSGANLEVSGRCDNGEVIFTIKNTGAAMTEPEQYVVIEDIMIQMTGGGPVLLAANQTQTVALPANGSTWRLEIPQAPFHPWSTQRGVSVEGCGTNGSGSFSTGFVTQFPYADESPAFDTDCHENVASFDPNDKQGFPRGVYDEHFIPENQEISYHIRFQNTGTDTAFNIVILDTLSESLELATLRAGAASHPYTYNILGPGVIQFLFQNILLPDSNVNEAASHGFVQFSIRPKADLPKPTVIENAAAIYFDFNEPVITNRTWHTVGEKYLNISNVVFLPGLELDVYPNPASTAATFFLKSSRPMNGRLLLFDTQGRPARQQAFQTNVFDINLTGLPPGLYFYRLESEGKVVAAGKVGVLR